MQDNQYTPPILPSIEQNNAAMSGSMDKKLWEMMEKTLTANVVEQRRARRWGIFFKCLFFIYLIAIVMIPLMRGGFGNLMDASADGESTGPGHTALVELKGAISDDSDASADRIITGLRGAFADKNTQGVILRINSPGGSPVQSGYIYDEIKRLRAKHPTIKLYAVITDVGASGAYYVAAAADEIYADKASLVGSIGVTAASFGFVDTMQKLGVERRVYTSGSHKAFLDPFQPQKDDEKQFWQGVLGKVHQQFIDAVTTGRGDKLKHTEQDQLFSGLIWSGEQALSLGLIDGFASSSAVARDVIKSPRIVNFGVQTSAFDRLAKRLGSSAGASLHSALLGSDTVWK